MYRLHCLSVLTLSRGSLLSFLMGPYSPCTLPKKGPVSALCLYKTQIVAASVCLFLQRPRQCYRGWNLKGQNSDKHKKWNENVREKGTRPELYMHIGGSGMEGLQAGRKHRRNLLSVLFLKMCLRHLLQAGIGYSMYEARYSMYEARYSMFEARYSMYEAHQPGICYSM